jgi:very-short-patch-repair endonuclease
MTKQYGWNRALRVWTQLKPKARAMRQQATQAEALLWERLRKNQLLRFGFRRQHAIGPFITDFCCPKAKLVVEVDGGIHHQQVQEDKARQQYLESRGFRVMRFTNEQVERNIEVVLSRIEKELKDRGGSQPPPQPDH